jgi:hypothetical protein
VRDAGASTVRGSYAVALLPPLASAAEDAGGGAINIPGARVYLSPTDLIKASASPIHVAVGLLKNFVVGEKLFQFIEIFDRT